MKWIWIPSGPVCLGCGGPKPKGMPCKSCDYEPNGPLWPKEALPLEKLKERAAILTGLGLQFAIPKKIREILEGI